MQSDDDYVGEIKTTGQLLSIVKLKTTGSSPFISSEAQYTAQTFPCEHFDAMVAHFDASLGAKAIGEILPPAKLAFAPVLQLSLAHPAPFVFSGRGDHASHSESFADSGERPGERPRCAANKTDRSNGRENRFCVGLWWVRVMWIHGRNRNSLLASNACDNCSQRLNRSAFVSSTGVSRNSVATAISSTVGGRPYASCHPSLRRS